MALSLLFVFGTVCLFMAYLLELNLPLSTLAQMARVKAYQLKKHLSGSSSESQVSQNVRHAICYVVM